MSSQTSPVECSQIVFKEPGAAVLQRRELPPLGDEEIRIRTLVSLISPGTERAFFLGLPNTTQVYPQYSGYNNVGEVVARGSQVSRLEVGTVVASPAHHASVVQVSMDETYVVPPGLSIEGASFFNLVSIALQGVRKARIEIGEHVAVLGAGLIGILAAQLALESGALPVTIIDQESSRLNFARAVGVESTHERADSQATAARGPHTGGSPEVVIEATGHPDAVNDALTLCAPGGRVVLLGSTRGVTPEVNFYRDVHRKGLAVIGAHDIARPRLESHAGYWTQSADREVSLRLLASGRIQVTPLITHCLQWRDAVSAYELLKAWDVDALGILLDWRSG